jgi:hypothetical protein
VDDKLTTNFGAYDYAYSGALQTDGKIVAAGHKFDCLVLIVDIYPNVTTRMGVWIPASMAQAEEYSD